MLELPKPTQVVNLKQYRIPGGQKEITTLMSDMLEAGVVVPTNSLYDSPVWPVKKADGSCRLTDYRRLNKGALPIASAVPDIVSTT